MVSNGSHAAIWVQNLLEERDGIALYEGLAASDPDPVRSRIFRRLAEGERAHADVWEKKLTASGSSVPLIRVSLRVRLLLWIARRFGVTAALPWILTAELKDVDKYTRQGGESMALAAEEREHFETLTSLGAKGDFDGAPKEVGVQPARDVIAVRERWHRGGRAGSVRAAIFGINDGLVSNVALVLGVAAAGADHRTLVVTGLAGLIAGAFSMAAGEFISVASQRDLLKRQVELEARELAESPEEEEAELGTLLAQKGLSPDQATEVARGIMKNPHQALDTLVREELGLDPGDLGSPIGAAVASFMMFALGAAIPLVPFLIMSAPGASVLSGLLSASVLAGVGALVGVLSGTGAFRSAIRMVTLAGIAAGVTIGVGRLIGVSVS